MILTSEKCSVCGDLIRGATTVVDGREFYQVFGEAYVADSYPPGDDGLIFVCGLSCLAQFKDHEHHPDAKGNDDATESS